MSRSRWLIAAVVLTFLPTAAPAQFATDQAQTFSIRPDGYDLFCGVLLGVHRMEAVTQDYLDHYKNFDDLVVISLGTPVNENALFWANQVTVRGGAALIASDTLLDLRRWIAAEPRIGPGYGILGWQLKQAAKTNTYYADKTDCPFAVPLNPPRLQDGPEWRIFRGLNRVATNQPSCLYLPRQGDGGWHAIATFPVACSWRGNAGENIEDHDRLQYPLAITQTDDHQERRLLVIADPSVFINEMMLPADGAQPTDNLIFTHRAIDYLQTKPDGSKRTHFALFINGTLVSDFRLIQQYLKPPLPPLPAPPPIRKMLLAMQEKLVDAGNQIIDRVQQNYAAHPPFTRGSAFRDLVSVLLILAVIWAIIQLLLRVWKSRQQLDIPVPPPGGRAGDAAEAPGVFDRRQRELQRRNNLFEPVRETLCEMFTLAGAPVDARAKLPRIEIADAVLKPETLRKALTDLWALAYGPTKVLTVQQWNVLEPLFLRARRAYLDGKWRFVERRTVESDRNGQSRMSAEAQI